MAITNSNDSSHIVRTSAQWKSSYDSYDTIPLGVLCVELIPDGSMKIKIGDGHNTFAKLPYVGGQAVSDYYSKRETDERIKAILKEESPMCIKGVLSGEAALPSNPVVGDVYFVLSRSSSSYIEYVYATNHSWIPIGGTPVDSDLSGYATQDYVNEQIDEVNTRIDEIVKGGTSSHTHDNKDILDSTTASFTKEDKAKLDSMSSFTSADRDKLNVLIKNSTSFEKIAALEKLAHEHSNKRILDRTTASFTTDYEQKMKWIRPYTGAENGYEGIMGLVPPAQPGEEDYVLNGAGEWVPMEVDSSIEIYNVTAGLGIEIEVEDKTVDEESNSYKVSLKPSTEFEIGGIIPGNGLSVDTDGILNIKYDTTTLDINENNELTVIGGNDGKSISYIAGDAIDIHSSEELIKLTPNMTGFTTPKGEVIQRGQWDDRYGWLAFDGIDNKYYKPNAWCGGNEYKLNGLPDTCYVGYLFEETVFISKFVISFFADHGYEGCIQVYKNKDWITVVEKIEITGSPYYSEFTFDIPITECEGFRFSMLSGHNSYMGGTTYGSNVCEFEAYGYRHIPSKELTIDVKYGNGLTINEDNQLEVEPYELPVATETTLGGIIVGDNLTIEEDGKLSAVIPEIRSDFIFEEGPGIEISATGSSTSESQIIEIINTGVLDVKPSEEKNQIIITTKDGDKPINIDIESNQGVLDVKSSDKPNQIIITTADGDKEVDIDISAASMNDGYVEGEAIQFTDVSTDSKIKKNPTMTSYTEPEGTVIYSGEYLGRPAYGPFDGIDSEYWDVHSWSDNVNIIDGTPDACYDGYMFDNEVSLSKFIISFAGTHAYTGIIQVHKEDGWETVVEEFSIPVNYNSFTFDIDPVTCDGFRCSIISSVDGNPYFSTTRYGSNICNFEAWGSNVAKGINVKYSDGLYLTKNNELAAKKYIAGTGITIEETELITEITLDIWNDGDKWSNIAYASQTSNVIFNWAVELHSSVGTMDDIQRYPIISPTRRLKYIKYDIDGNPLSGHIDFHNSDGVKFTDIGWLDDNDEIHTIPENVEYISFALRKMDHTSSISSSEVGRATIVWLDINDADILVNKISLNPATIDTIGGVKPGRGLTIDEDGTLNADIVPIINGIPGEEYLIKSLVYTGTGGVNNIVFPEKPLGIISISGLGKDNNYLYSTPTSIDNEYMAGIWGGATGTGQMLSYMSFEESTNTLTLTGKSHINDADNFNVPGLEYTVLYAVPIPVSEAYIFKTLTYTGNGEAINNIVFPEKPEFVVSMYGYAVRNWITCESFEFTSNKLMYQYGGESNNGVGTCNLSFDKDTNTLSLYQGADRGAIFNVNGEKYVVRYAVKSTVYATSDGGSGSYKLPPATTESLGGVIVGDGLIVDKNGVLSMMNKPVDTSTYVAGEAISIIESESGEYDVLEYVISNQTQYVLTDIFPGDTTEIYLKYQLTNISTDSYIVSSGYKFAQGCLMYGILLINREVLCSAIGTGNNIYAYNSIIPDLDIHEDTYTVTSTTFGSTLTGTNNHSYILNKTEPIQLFGTPGLSYGSSVKLYAMKITVDGSLISELIPVRNKAASNIGLYDKLTGKIYYSKEGTKLEAGPSTGEIIKITGDNIINVKYSDGLSINENNELFVDGKEDAIPRFTKAEYEQAVIDGTAPPPGSLFIITDDEEDEPEIPDYELPIASKEVLGGIKVGEGLVINNDAVLSMDNIHAYQVDMKDYQPGDDYIPIVQSDSVSTAIGKLDVGLITKENKIRRFTKAEYDQAVLDGTAPAPGELFVITDDYTTQIDPEKPFGVTDVVAAPNEVGKLNVYNKTVDVFEYLELMTLNCVGDGEAP